MHLSDMTVDLPERDTAIADAQALLERFRAASSVDEQWTVLRELDAMDRQLATLDSLTYIRFSQDTADTSAKAHRTFMDELSPAVDVHLVDLRRAVLASPHLAVLTERLGEHTIARWRADAMSFSEAVAADQATESALVMEYMGLMASVRVDWEGESKSLGEMREVMGRPDRATRQRAAELRDAALAAKAPEMDVLFSKLTSLRHSMALKLEQSSYTPIGYAQMGRTDYTEQDAAVYRQQVLDHVVPLCTAIRKRRAKALGIAWSDYRVWDESIADPAGVPRPKGDHDWMLAQASKMFSKLGDDFSAFFETMTSQGLLDLKSREGKAGGGYCTALYDHKVPFIFANFNGTQDDVNVFTHECGHAFQKVKSLHHEVIQDIRPTAESAEMHSMSLEHLCYPHMELFFGDDADRYRTQHLEGALLFLPYGCAIDEFQHAVYENPEWTAEQRNAHWLTLEAKYLPWRHNGDLANANTGRAWQAQRHVYFRPFYYIDYCLAETVALQFWQLAEADRTEAMRLYRELCSLGGTKAFQGLVAQVGLKSPLQPGTLQSIATDVAGALGL